MIPIKQFYHYCHLKTQEEAGEVHLRVQVEGLEVVVVLVEVELQGVLEVQPVYFELMQSLLNPEWKS